jgi:PAS domain S-box-containing protein
MGEPETAETAPQTLPRVLRPVLDPSVPTPDPTVRRRARLLAAFLLVLIVVFGVVDLTSLLTVPGYRPPWYGYVFLGGAFLLNRWGRHTWASGLTLAMFPAVILGIVLSGARQPALTLVHLAPGVVLASILLSARGTALFASLCAATVLAVPLLPLAAAPSLGDVVPPLTLVAITAGLAVVAIRHRDRLERDRQAELRDGEERLRSALEAAHMATWEWDLATGAVRWSEGAERLFGEGGGPGTVDGYRARIHPDDRPAADEAVRSALEGGRRYSVRHRVLEPGGVVRWLEGHGRVDRDREGRPVRTRGTILDVTERQKAEAEREQLIRELEAKNTELEQFTHTVSHDLKSPLITMRGFLGLVERDVAEGRTDRLKADLERVRGATDSMQRLLHELLALSRVGRIVNPSERVSFGEIAREAAALVRPRLEERGVRVEIAPDLPEVFADRARLVHVVQNLLENAVKFLGDQAAPAVEVGVRPGTAGGPPTLFVRDNGVGIDPRFHEKVFGLFEKLDPRAEGTGVGLALVKRIVEVHGGRVWIESAGRGQGTTVCLTLPLPPAG